MIALGYALFQHHVVLWAAAVALRKVDHVALQWHFQFPPGRTGAIKLGDEILQEHFVDSRGKAPTMRSR